MIATHTPRPANPTEYALTYLGHIIDVFDSYEDAKAGRVKLVADIRADRLPDFLGPDDITGVEDFTIVEQTWE